MNKNIYTLLSLLLCAVVLFSSCSSEDDNDEQNAATAKWKAYNEGLLNDSINTGKYTERKSTTGNGSVYWKRTAEPTDPASFTPQFTDSVDLRFMVWYFDYDGKKITVDGTEEGFNQPEGRGFRISNYVTATGSSEGAKAIKQVTDGLATMLQYMREGEEAEFCVPQALGYGASTKYMVTPAVVPPYTTLCYKVKIQKAILGGR